MKKIYSCFIYNGEKEILNLHLNALYPFVDHFIISEANQTFSGKAKPYYILSDKKLFNDYGNKIIVQEVQFPPEINNIWEREFFLRNTLKNRINFNDDDILIIGDADEIVNFNYVFNKINLDKPWIIELDVFYYYINVKSSEKVQYTLITKYIHIKDMPIGDRNGYIKFLDGYKILKTKKGRNGGHFTYLFGSRLQLYIDKISSFSHQEFNNEYYLNKERLNDCIKYMLDLYGRNFYLKRFNTKKIMPELYESILNHSYTHLIKRKLNFVEIYKGLKNQDVKNQYIRVKKKLLIEDYFKLQIKTIKFIKSLFINFLSPLDKNNKI